MDDRNPNNPETDMSTEEVSLLSDRNRNLPSSRVRGILNKPVAVSVTTPASGRTQQQQAMFSRMLFSQMDILCHFPDGSKGWKEAARWIKYEEAVDNAGRWSQPYVPVAFLRSIIDVRRTIDEGTASVDLALDPNARRGPGDSVSAGIAELLADTFQRDRNLAEDERALVVQALMATHKHAHRGRKPDHDGCCDGCCSLFSRCRNALPYFKQRQYAHDTYLSNMTPEDLSEYKPNKDLMKKMPADTEVALILIGQLPFVQQQPLVGFFRLQSAILLDEMSEVALPVRFIFVYLSSMSIPIQALENYGRAVAMLVTDKIFCEVAYRMTSKQELLDGVDEYVDQLVVLPPSIWDPTSRMAPPHQSRSLDKVQERLEQFSIYVQRDYFAPDGAQKDETLLRTGRPFGGLVNDVKRKARLYWSDIKDALHYQSLATVLFLFFACLTPLVTFGGLMGEDTDNYLGTLETIISGAICGIVFHLFAGQPLITIGAVGPVLVYEVVLYQFSQSLGVDFLSFRFWVGAWMFAILFLFVAFELNFLIRYMTRFTEESFTILNSLIYIAEALSKLIESWHIYPVHLGPYRNSDQYGCHCNPWDDNKTVTAPANWKHARTSTTSATTLANQTLATVASFVSDSVTAIRQSLTVNSTGPWTLHNWTAIVDPDCITGHETIIVNFRCIDEDECLDHGWSLDGVGCYEENITKAVPDVFFLCWILALGTFVVAVALKHFRMSSYFPSIVRNVVGDFAVFEAIIIFTVFDWYFGIATPKLVLPDKIETTRTDRSFIVNPFSITAFWVIPLAIIPGALGVILMFLDQQISALIINRPEHKLKKGGGYHLDLLVVALLILLTSFMGLPWLVASPVRSLMHVNSLKKESEIRIPGEHPKITGVREQRVTGLVIHLLIALSALLTGVLKFIPMPVLYGVFLYMGYSSMHGLQFVQRILLMFRPKKYQPDYEYLRHVKIKRVHIFTLIQIGCMVVLWTIKSIDEIALLFPIVLLAVCFVRRGMAVVFDTAELYWLDGLLPNELENKKSNALEVAFQRQQQIQDSMEMLEASRSLENTLDNKFRPSTTTNAQPSNNQQQQQQQLDNSSGSTRKRNGGVGNNSPNNSPNNNNSSNNSAPGPYLV